MSDKMIIARKGLSVSNYSTHDCWWLGHSVGKEEIKFWFRITSAAFDLSSCSLTRNSWEFPLVAFSFKFKLRGTHTGLLKRRSLKGFYIQFISHIDSSVLPGLQHTRQLFNMVSIWNISDPYWSLQWMSYPYIYSGAQFTGKWLWVYPTGCIRVPSWYHMCRSQIEKCPE